MKISFSTLGCPEWSWEDMVVTAKDMGFDGIEVRGIENELYIPKAKPFLPINLENTIARLSNASLEIPCLTSSCFLFDKANSDFYLNEGKEYIDLAQRLSAPYIRVLGDTNPEPNDEIDLDFVAANLSILAGYSQGKKVKVLIETNGVLSNSDTLFNLIKKVDSKNVGVLWDVHHPFRYMNESIEKTFATLKEYIEFVHVKDSLIEDGKVKYKMMGYGDIPVKDAIKKLKVSGYKGFVSLEWVKRWNMDLEGPGVAFSHFVNYMRNL